MVLCGGGGFHSSFLLCIGEGGGVPVGEDDQFPITAAYVQVYLTKSL